MKNRWATNIFRTFKWYQKDGLLWLYTWVGKTWLGHRPACSRKECRACASAAQKKFILFASLFLLGKKAGCLCV